MWQPGRVKEKHTKVVNNIATEGKEMTTGGQNLLKLDCQDWVEKVGKCTIGTQLPNRNKVFSIPFESQLAKPSLSAQAQQQSKATQKKNNCNKPQEHREAFTDNRAEMWVKRVKERRYSTDPYCCITLLIPVSAVMTLTMSCTTCNS